MDVRFLLLFLCLNFSHVLCYEDKTIYQYIHDASEYMFLKSIIDRAQLNATLSGTGPLTLFAPSDAAILNLGPDVINSVTDSQLRVIIQYHIIEGFVLAPVVSSPTNFTTLLGDDVLIEQANGTLLLNGMSWVSDVNNDIIVNNGVVQEIDTVLMPPGNILTTETIAQILIQDDTRFKDIFLAFVLADLVSLLDSGDYTFFAPTDAAFAKYSNNLLDPSSPNAQTIYQEVLKHHLVPGGRLSSQIKTGNLFTLHGTALNIQVTGSDIKINTNVNVIEKNIYAANGVIHVIDDILFPSDLNPSG